MGEGYGYTGYSGSDDADTVTPAGTPLPGSEGADAVPSENDSPNAPSEGLDGGDTPPEGTDGAGDDTPPEEPPPVEPKEEEPAPVLRSAPELRSTAPTAGDELPGQSGIQAFLAAAEASRGEPPYATPQIVDFVASGAILDSVVTAEETQQDALEDAHDEYEEAADDWRADHFIDHQVSRPLNQTTD